MYGNLTDLLKLASEHELIQLTDDEGVVVPPLSNPENADALARINAALTDATIDVDARLGSAVSVPLFPIPDIIRNVSARIALCLLRERRTLPGEEMMDGIMAMRKSQYALLADISAGRIRLSTSAAAATDAPIVSPGRPRMNMDGY